MKHAVSVFLCEQYVSINNHRSTTLPIRTGVPPGSILGPLVLFILYINGIVNVCKDAEILLFTDGTNVFLHDTDIYQLSVRANKALSNINNWFKLNKLSVNVKKCNLYYSLLDQSQLILK